MKEKLSVKIKRFYHEHEDTILTVIGLAVATSGLAVGYFFGYINGFNKALNYLLEVGVR